MKENQAPNQELINALTNPVAKSYKRRTTDDLSWDQLRTDYRIRFKDGVIENELEAAIADGSLRERFEACAEKLYNGNLHEVAVHFSRNIASKKQYLIDHPNILEQTRFNLLVEFTKGLMNETRAKNAEPLSINLDNGNQWNVTIEMIDKIDKADYAAFNKIYNSMASQKTKYPEKIAAIIGMDEFKRRYDYVSKLRSAARELMANEEARKAFEGKKEIAQMLIDQRAKAGTPMTDSEIKDLYKTLGI